MREALSYVETAATVAVVLSVILSADLNQIASLLKAVFGF